MSKYLKQKLRHFIDKGHLEWIKFCLSCIFVNKNFARLAKTLQQAQVELAKEVYQHTKNVDKYARNWH